MLVLVVRLEGNQTADAALLDDIAARNRSLPDFKRVYGYVIGEKDFPRTASMKIIRPALGKEIAASKKRSDIVML